MAALIPTAIFLGIAIAYIALLVWLNKPRQPQAFPNPGSAKLAAIEYWVRENFMPEHWPEQKKRTVIELLREGKSPAEIARAGAFNIKQIKQIRLALNSNSIAYVSLGQVRRMGNVDPDEEPTKPRDRFKPNVFKSARGSIALEFALIAPVFLLLLLFGFQIGYAIHQYNVMAFAVSAAAKCGADAAQLCPDDSHTLGYASALAGYDGAAFDVAHPACGVRVAGQVRSDLIANLSWIPFIDLSVDACYPEGKPMSVADLGNCNVDLYGKTRTVSDALNPVWHNPVQIGGDAMVQVVCVNKVGSSVNQWVVN